jgi:solute:Na+ symporter, SSS family
VQRLAGCRRRGDAEKAAWFFNIMHYVVRTWPWIVVAIVALVIYPDLEDRELGYPLLMLDFLPVGSWGSWWPPWWRRS